MKQLFASVGVLAVLMMVGCAGGPTGAIRDKDALDKWVGDYAKAPAPELLTDALDYMDASGMTADNPEKTMPFYGGFMGHIMRNNTDLLPALFKRAAAWQLPTRRLVWYAAWESNTPAARAQILHAQERETEKAEKERLKNLLQDKVVPLNKRAVTSVADLDLFWGIFFASGDTAYVRRVIGVLGAAEDDATAVRTIVAKAEWTLTTNAKKHPKVLAVCRGELAKANQPARGILQAIVTGAEEQKKKEATEKR
jgi:hypothetical protein